MGSLQVLDNLAQEASHFTTHSGEISENGIFVALKGEKRDAHDFVNDVLKKNPKAIIVEKETGIQDPRIHRVPSTQQAHWEIAKIFRNKFKGKVIGIGGSNGKTSTKDFLYFLLSKRFNCIKTEKSQNGLLGIPKTLEKLRDGVDFAVIEIGVDAPGDMKRNVDLVRPDIAVLTSIGEEHLNLLKDLDGVFAEERVLVDWADAHHKKSFCPASDSYLKRLKAKGLSLVEKTPMDINSTFNVQFKETHMLQNAAVAIRIALELGMSAEAISSHLKEMDLVDGRGLKWKISEDLWVIRDHYNANPSSMTLAIESAIAFSKEKNLPLKCILGDMLDLGLESESSHQKIVALAQKSGATELLWVGPLITKHAQILQINEKSPVSKQRQHFISSSDAPLSEELVQFFKSGVILVKASRGTALENVMNRLFGFFK